MLPSAVKTKITEIIAEQTGRPVTITKASGIGGGCINDAHRVETDQGSFFVKFNHAGRFPGMFEAEARGLKLLYESQQNKSRQGHAKQKNARHGNSQQNATRQNDSPKVDVPRVIGFGEQDDISMLVLEYIESIGKTPDFWQDFGQGLANLHRHQPETGEFGLNHDNYIGSLPQQNHPHKTWTEFFVNQRLEPQLKMARDSGKAGGELAKMFDRLYSRLQEFFPEEPPSLLHGDLWSGNYMTGDKGQAVIIDPAVYYGHRYMDLGMSKLFGGFSTAFYEAYNDAWPLEPSWHESMDIANLYPLMVHVNLFGGGYLSSVKGILKRF